MLQEVQSSPFNWRSPPVSCLDCCNKVKLDSITIHYIRPFTWIMHAQHIQHEWTTCTPAEMPQNKSCVYDCSNAQVNLRKGKVWLNCPKMSSDVSQSWFSTSSIRVQVVITVRYNNHYNGGICCDTKIWVWIFNREILSFLPADNFPWIFYVLEICELRQHILAVNILKHSVSRQSLTN